MKKIKQIRVTDWTKNRKIVKDEKKIKLYQMLERLNRNGYGPRISNIVYE